VINSAGLVLSARTCLNLLPQLQPAHSRQAHIDHHTPDVASLRIRKMLFRRRQQGHLEPRRSEEAEWRPAYSRVVVDHPDHVAKHCHW
jgi:hypothetical protein